MRPNDARPFGVFDQPKRSAFAPDERNRRIKRKPRRERDRARAGAAAAMRGRERLVQVDVHGVDAEVARTRLADDGVEIRAVAIEIGARLVNGVGDADDLALEQSASVGIGQHDRRDVGRERRAHRFDADDPVLARGDGAHRIADQRGGCGIRAMRGIGNQHHAPRLPLPARLDRRLDRHHAAELAVRAGLWRHCDGVHARHRQKRIRQRLDDLERPLRGRNRLQWVDVRESGQPRHFLVEAGIVLHRAGAQRIDPGVDRIIVARQAHVMADRLGLVEAGQIVPRFGARAAPASTGTTAARRCRRRSRQSGRYRR